MVLSIPHGGGLTPSEIEDRMPGCPNANTGECDYIKDENCADEDECPCTTVTDSYTITVGNLIVDELVAQLGGRPHLVISNLKRYLS